MNILRSRKFQDLFFGSFISALVWVFWGRFFYPEPTMGLWHYPAEVFVTTFVIFNLTLWWERIWLARDFDAVAGEVLSRRAVIFVCLFVVAPIIALTAIIPTGYSIPFGRNLFWMSYIGLGIGLWVWNISTKLLTPKKGMIAVTDECEEIEAGKFIPAPLFAPLDSLPNVILDKKKRK